MTDPTYFEKRFAELDDMIEHNEAMIAQARGSGDKKQLKSYLSLNARTLAVRRELVQRQREQMVLDALRQLV